MKKKAMNLRLASAIMVMATLMISCEEDKPVQPVAGFTFEVTDLSVTFTNTSENGKSYAWDFGDGGTSADMNPVHAYTAAGTYEVELTVTGEKGSDPSVYSESVTVTAPELPNLIQGGSFETADVSKWTVLHSGQKDKNDPPNFIHVKYQFGYTDYKPTAGVGGCLYIFPDNDAVTPSEEGTIFYQKLTGLTAGTYQISALVRLAGENKDNPTSAMNNYWFEINVHDVLPTEGDGYNYGRVTGWYYGGWTGWKIVVPALNGPIPHNYLDDNKADDEGKFSLATNGDYYVVIKAGKGWDSDGTSFGDGIALDELKLVKLP